MSRGYDLLLMQAPNFHTPLQVIECLHMNSCKVALSKLSDKHVNAILWYFNDCLENTVSTLVMAKLKDMPLFLSHFGKRVVLSQYRSVYIVPEKLPEEGLEELADKANVLFLRNTRQKNLFKLLHLGALSLIQVYTQYIIPQQQMLSRKCFYGHLFFLGREIVIETEDNIELLALLRRTAFIESTDGQRVRVSDLFDPVHEVFSRMCDNSELVPLCLRDACILRLFRKIGLKSQMTIELFERFARKISSRGKRESLSKRVTEESEILTKHLLSMPHNFFASGVFTNISKIDFVMPYAVNDTLYSIKEQFNCNKLICFEDAVVNKSQKIAWTVSNILPVHADPSFKHRDELIMEKLKICRTPCLRKLVRHCEHIGKGFERILKSTSTVSHEELRYVMRDIYDALSTFVDTEQFTVECSLILAHAPMVYYPETKIIVTANSVTFSCKSDEEIPPYFSKCPESYSQYKKLFLGLGACEEPSCNSFARVLNALKGEAEEKILNPKESFDAAKAVGYLYKYLAEEKGIANISDDQLFLLSSSSTLLHARKLIIPNNIYLQNQLAKSGQTTCVYHIGFEKLHEFHLKSEDCIENLKHLPKTCQPYLLTDVVKERVILENIKQEDRRKSESFEGFLRCNEFVFGFLRLVRHVWKSENRGWKETDASMLSEALKSITFTHCSGIETKLAMKSIENGKLGSEILVDNTNERKFSHIEVNEQSAFVYFDSSDTQWRRNVIKHLTVYLNGEHLVFLMHILGMYEKPDEIGLYLSKEQIEEFTFEPSTLDDRPAYPIPGQIVPKHFLEFLDNELIIYEYDFKFMALEVDDPAFDLDEEDENDNGEEKGETMEATYIFVHIIRRIGPEHELPLLQEYEIDCGPDNTDKVKGFQLFKFVRKTKNANADQRQVVIYERSTNGQDNESKNNRKESKSLTEVRKEIRQYLREAWNKDEQEKRCIIKRLMLRWHPDKNPNDVPFCTKVFQYIQQCLNRLEKGLELTDDDEDDEENGTDRNTNSDSTGTYNTSFGSNRNSWYNRYWQRYTRGRQYSERRYEHYRSSQRSRYGGSWHNNFENTWKARFSYAQSENEPYHWYSRAKLWYTQAKYDLRNARASMHLQCLNPQFNWVCYKAHQAAEKALKAVWYAKDANKVHINLLSSHRLEYIASGVGSEAQTLAKRLSNLTGDHAKMSYPDPHYCKIPAESFSKHTAESVVEIAEDILRVCSRYIKEG